MEYMLVARGGLREGTAVDPGGAYLLNSAERWDEAGAHGAGLVV